MNSTHMGMSLEAIQDYTTVYKYLALLIMSVGLLGNSLWLFTLHRSYALRTPHFLYYKALTLAEWVYCVEFFVDQILERCCSSPFGMGTFSSYAAAFVSYIWSRTVFAVTGYMASYALMAITVDRFLAIWRCTWYQVLSNSRKRRFALKYIAISFILSVTVHSWFAIAGRKVVPLQFQTDITSFLALKYDDPFLVGEYNSTTYEPPFYAKLIKIMNIYNLIFRVVHPLIILSMTVAVIVGYRRHILRRAIRRHDIRRLRPSQHNLVALMLIVVLLCFLQIIPRELVRLVELAGKPGSPNHALLHLTILANISTQIDRSLKFYFCILFNEMFRRETLKALLPRSVLRRVISTSQLPSFSIYNPVPSDDVQRAAISDDAVNRLVIDCRAARPTVSALR